MKHLVPCVLVVCFSIVVYDCDALWNIAKRRTKGKNRQKENQQTILPDGWSSWISYEECSKTCGGGIMTQTRICLEETSEYGTNRCLGASKRTMRCNTEDCPDISVDGGWSAWKPGQCSKTCGKGRQKLVRFCNNPKPGYGGKRCIGKRVKYKPCNTHECPVHGAWSYWSSYGECSKTCGEGVQTKTRTCTGPKPEYGGRRCEGPSSKTRQCNTKDCPVDGGWSVWKPGKCSEPCGAGKQKLVRYCNNPKPGYGGKDCEGKSTMYRPCNTHKCPVHGGWTYWSSYGDCSNTCGGGIQTQTRTCTGPTPQHGGRTCPGPSTRTRRCNTKKCPVDGGWSVWKPGKCSEPCGAGKQKLVRYCNNPKPGYGGKDCDGKSTMYRPCNTHKCPVHGGWTYWSSYGDCSNTCGGGIQTQTRTCTGPTPQYGGRKCPGPSTRTRKCNTKKCPVDGGWSAWKRRNCSKPCGRGRQKLVRYCNNPKPSYGGNDCEGENMMFRPCNTHKCPVHGGWTYWSSYGDCSKSCGGGIQTKTRTCTGPKPQYGGRRCSGPSSMTRRCNTKKCPVDGGWSVWKPGACSKTCGDGRQKMVRYCNNPKPQYGGKTCGGDDVMYRPCNTHECPVDGGWTYWSSYGECSKTCGGGVQTQKRTCTAPEPQNGGRRCTGPSTKTKRCNVKKCPVHGGWSAWKPGACSKTCGGGRQKYVRYCNNPKPAYGGRKCLGRSKKHRPCNTHKCPVHGGWSSWGPYGSCSKSCGGGIQTQERVCNVPLPIYGGNRCPGESSRTRRCNTKKCSIDGGWSAWKKKGSCSATCDGGHQKLVRYCNNPKPRYGGAKCVGNDIMYKECNTERCPVHGGWSPWSPYGPCSKSCGGGIQTQKRTCNVPFPEHGGNKCSGRSTRKRQCNNQKCPVDGNWSEWRKYGSCSRKCGGGKQTLVRLCDNPEPDYNGKMCTGTNIKYKRCNSHRCAVHGKWSDWSSYSECSKTCGGGIQTQTRDCSEPKYGGRKCLGRSTRARRCNIETCPETCKCIAMGDPHYKTYDGQLIHFQGTCKYLLTELTNKYDPCWFSVSVQNEHRGSKRVSYTKMVEITIQGTKINLRKKGIVQVNGAQVYLPYTKQGKLRIYRSGFDVHLETRCGLVVTWNKRFTVSVSVQGEYRSQLRGICGDCNGKKDDLKTQEGVDVSRERERDSLIGDSWRIKDGSGIKKCTPPGPPPVCTDEMRERALQNDACGFINPKNKEWSPFKLCILQDTDTAQEIFENCIYDYCTYAKKTEEELKIAICNAVEGFAETCKELGLTAKWRSNTFCPMPCGKNQVYSYETSGCPATCVNPDAPKTCIVPKVEGCECREGYVLSDDTCVKLSSCGCYSNGKYYPVGARIKKCYKELHCKLVYGRPELQVTDIKCSRFSVCKQIYGQYKCVCKDGYTGDGITCKPKGCGGEKCHRFAFCYKNRCKCRHGYYGDGVETCDGGCQVRRKGAPHCGISYHLSGTCHFTSEMRDDCQYTVDLSKDKHGKARAVVRINKKIQSFEYGYTIKDCAMFTLRSTALIIRDRSCPDKCYKSQKYESNPKT